MNRTWRTSAGGSPQGGEIQRTPINLLRIVRHPSASSAVRSGEAASSASIPANTPASRTPHFPLRHGRHHVIQTIRVVTFSFSLSTTFSTPLHAALQPSQLSEHVRSHAHDSCIFYGETSRNWCEPCCEHTREGEARSCTATASRAHAEHYETTGGVGP